MIVNVIYGFLGAGKTTLIRHLLANPPGNEKWVVLVNEFGSVGLDGIVLENEQDETAEVVEVSAGCICCTMATDFRRQIFDLSEKFSPDRLIIEPTGVATISQITAILDRKDVRPLYDRIQLILILDATEFLSFMKSNRHFMENQIRAAEMIILNKVDRVSATRTGLLTESIKEMKPGACVISSDFCRLNPSQLNKIFENDRTGEDSCVSDFPAAENRFPGHDHNNDMAARYQTYGKRYKGKVFNQDGLKRLFECLKMNKLGDTVRAKGNFNTNMGWSRLELASGEISMEKGTVARDNVSVVSIIGRFMNTVEIDIGLEKCILEKCGDDAAAP